MSGRDGPPPLAVGLGPVLRLICKGLEALKKCASKLQDAIWANDANRLRLRLDAGAESCQATREVRAMDLIDTVREFARRLRLERDSAAGSNEEVFGGFTARLRFRVSKRLEIPEYEQDVEFRPYKATLLAQDKGQPIRESDWLILRVKGLGTEEEARKIGEKLKVAVALSSARARLGVDIGNDKPTGSVANFVVEAIRDEFHVEIRPNVHGLDVYSDTSPVLVLNINANALVSTKPEPFLSGTWRFFNEEWPVTPRLQQAVILLICCTYKS